MLWRLLSEEVCSWVLSAAVINILAKSNVGEKHLCHPTGYCPAELNDVKATTQGSSLKQKQ